MTYRNCLISLIPADADARNEMQLFRKNLSKTCWGDLGILRGLGRRGREVRRTIGRGLVCSHLFMHLRAFVGSEELSVSIRVQAIPGLKQLHGTPRSALR